MKNKGTTLLSHLHISEYFWQVEFEKMQELLLQFIIYGFSQFTQ